MHAFVVYIIAAFVLLTVWEICSIVYRLFFHPLAHIPGPRIASATQWYEFYHDVLKWPGGQYWLEVDKMHERYGPIVRVTPYEVHIKDPQWYHELYCSSGEGIRDKYAPSAHMTGTPLGIFGTVNHELHRLRRGAITAFFSKRAIYDIEPWIHERTEDLCANIRHLQHRDNTVELRVNFLAMATDLIAAHALNGSSPQKTLHLLKDEEKAKDWQKTIAALAMLTALVKQAPWLIPIALKLSIGLWMMVAPPLGRIVRLNRDMRQSAQFTIDEASSPLGDKKPDFENTGQSGLPAKERHNIFRTILQSSLPPQEKSSKRLGQEGFVAIAAGGETCARMLSNGLYYIHANKDRVLPTLLQELMEVMPAPDVQPDLKALEQLPYLTAVIRETLRLSSILTSRLPLVAPDQALQYEGFIIPPGNPVSMSLRHILLNPDIFRAPNEFRPERWLKSNPDFDHINKFYVPFSRGTRNCIGINLAYAQLYIVLACVVRRFDLSFHEVIYDRDIKATRDCFIGEPRFDSPGVRVTVKEVIA